MAELPPLPPGFKLDNQATSIPPLPPGFALDSRSTPQVAAPRDPMNAPPLLPGEAGFDNPNVRPLDESYQTIGQRVAKYGQAINNAAAAMNRAKGDPTIGALEMLASMASGAVAAPFSALQGAMEGGTPEEQARIADDLQQRRTYSPRTDKGQAGMQMLGEIASPLTESGADVALGPLFAAESPAAVGPARIPRNAPDNRSGRPHVSAQSGPVAGAGAARAPGPVPAAAAQRTTGLEEVPEVAPDLVLEQIRRPARAQPTPATEPQARAREYVANTLGLDWNAIPARIQSTLTDVANDARALDSLDATALSRQIQLESLPVPVPATRGQLTRDPVQLRNEGNVAATDAGRSIRDTHADANQALLDNLDVLKGRVANRSGGAQTPEQVGLSVQDAALREKLRLKKSEVSARYKAAEEAGELQGKVSPARLIQTVRNSPDVSHFGWVESWLTKNEVIKKTEGGTVTSKLTLKQLEDLRQAAVARAMDGGTEGFYAGKVIKAIDDTTEGAGGNLYKEARKARREQALEFEETGAIARLVENKSRTDRATALEDTWRKTVVSGSVQDLRNVKRSLLTGGDANTRTAGRRAWRDIKAQTIQHIQNEATKSVALNERGQPNITPAAMKRAIDSIGDDKLNEIFGPGTATRLNRILDATRTVKTVPAPIHQGSSTMGNVLAFLERGLNKVPVIGDVGAGAIKAGVKLKEMGQAGRITREARRTPLSEAQRQAQRNVPREF